MELFTFVKQEIMKSGYYNLLPAGIVLSGGGAMLNGACDLCAQVTEMPTRVGGPRDVEGVDEALRSPIYATAVGLVQYGAQFHSPTRPISREPSLVGKVLRAINAFIARAMRLDH